MEDLKSALQDFNLSVSTVPEKGRSLVATRDFYPGISSLSSSTILLASLLVCELNETRTSLVQGK